MTTFKPTHIVVMGVSGTGKTSLALKISDAFNLAFAEGDDLHPQENIKKMSAGIPLTDEDRNPWLRTIVEWMRQEGEAGNNTVVTCSALKKKYRDTLREAGGRVLFLHLDGKKELVAQRLAARTDHFMPQSLLNSQFATLEPLETDEDGFVVDIAGTKDRVFEDAYTCLSAAF